MDEVDSSKSIKSASPKFPNEKFVNSAFKASLEEQNIKYFIKQRLLKKYFSSSDLYLMYYKEKYRISFLKNVAQVARLRRNSFSQSSFSEENANNDSQLYSDLLKVK